MEPGGGIGRVSLAAAGILAATARLAHADEVGPIERRAFRLLNSGIGVGERPVWLLMQLGNGLTALVAPTVLRAAGRSWADAARVGIAAHGGWQLAKLAKAIVDRKRPAALLDDVVLRDGDPTGRGFVSGHATVAMSVAVVARPMLPRSAQHALTAAAGGVALARVHVGAHLPLDVIGGAALAVLWGRSITTVTSRGRA